jgi:hypothetical protein
MSRPNGTREAWQPQSSQDHEAVLRELRGILASPHFCNSKRYPALLKFIVENTLLGKTDLLKERTIGVEVFDRPPTFDTNSDTVVRYTAGEVRKRLLLYYSESEQNSVLRISLPAGSYIPEFLREREDFAELTNQAAPPSEVNIPVRTGIESSEHDATSSSTNRTPTASSAIEHNDDEVSPSRPFRKHLGWLALAAILGIGLAAGVWWRVSAVQPQSALDDFWGPVLHDQRMVVVCIGGVVFQDNKFSGVITAGKDIEYPFVSMPIASAIAQISGVLEHSGVTTKLLSSPSTPLTELREHPVILLGGYNNQWSMRLLQSQRLQFTPEPLESIIDRTEPQARWSRDKSLSYSSADDYALIARFRDATTDSWVVVLAGLGRNGTEAATQFATSPRYMQLLREQARKGFSNRNIEAILKVSVIDGKTGAPSIQAVHVW